MHYSYYRRDYGGRHGYSGLYDCATIQWWPHFRGPDWREFTVWCCGVFLQVANNYVKTYSGGMKRRLSVALSFLGNPRIMFLDEPTTGIL